MITETFRDLPPQVKALRKLNENVLKLETYQKLGFGLTLPEGYRNKVEEVTKEYYRKYPDASRIPRETLTEILTTPNQSTIPAEII